MDENEILEWGYYIDGVKYWTTIDPEDGTLPKKRTVHKDGLVTGDMDGTYLTCPACEETFLVGSFTKGLSLLRRIKELEERNRTLEHIVGIPHHVFKREDSDGTV